MKQAILIRHMESVTELRFSHGLDGWYISPSMYRKPLFMDRIERNVFKKNHAGIDIGREFSSYDSAYNFALSLSKTIERDYKATVVVDDEVIVRAMLNAALLFS